MKVYHPRIMRTTVDIPDHPFSEAKQMAAERHPPLPLLREPALVAGVDLDDTSLLWELK